MGRDVLSLEEDEIRIRCLVNLCDVMFDRCEATLAATPHTLRCWLKTHSLNGYYPKPFRRPVTERAQKRYRGYWKQFIAFIFRAWLMDVEDRDAIYGVPITEDQDEIMDMTWEVLGEYEGTLLDEPTESQLAEGLFKLTCKFWTGLSPQCDPTSLASIYFTGVLSG